jgi:hypothetical protein
MDETAGRYDEGAGHRYSPKPSANSHRVLPICSGEHIAIANYLQSRDGFRETPLEVVEVTRDPLPHPAGHRTAVVRALPRALPNHQHLAPARGAAGAIRIAERAADGLGDSGRGKVRKVSLAMVAADQGSLFRIVAGPQSNLNRLGLVGQSWVV